MFRNVRKDSLTTVFMMLGAGVAVAEVDERSMRTARG